MSKSAELYRMMMPDHHCPFGRKSMWLLKNRGYAVDDHPLRTRAETDAFKEEVGVKTTPQTYIDGKRIGGWDDLRRHFGLPVAEKGATSYVPVIAIFAVSFLMAMAVVWAMLGTFAPVMVVEKFIAIAMCILGIQKLQDVESFSSMFLNYDVLAQKWVPYAYIYPFAETGPAS